jgi:hypothetical protein
MKWQPDDFRLPISDFGLKKKARAGLERAFSIDALLAIPNPKSKI